MDEVIFEEFKGTGNMEVRLDRKLSERRIFPALDVDASSTRKEELLLTEEELVVAWKLRRVLGALDPAQAWSWWWTGCARARPTPSSSAIQRANINNSRRASATAACGEDRFTGTAAGRSRYRIRHPNSNVRTCEHL